MELNEKILDKEKRRARHNRREKLNKVFSVLMAFAMIISIIVPVLQPANAAPLDYVNNPGVNEYGKAQFPLGYSGEQPQAGQSDTAMDNQARQYGYMDRILSR